MAIRRAAGKGSLAAEVTGTMPMRWGIYCRISDDPDDERAGVTRQEEDTRTSVGRRDGVIPDFAVYIENDTSAYKKKRILVKDPTGREYYGYRVIRPVWHQALADLREGKIDALMVWDLDRMARDPRDVEDAIEACQYYGKVVSDCTGIDLSTESGQTWARMAVTMAYKASADTSRRVARAHLQSAKNGQPGYNGRRSFGWNDDRMTLHETEAPAVIEAISRLIDGAITLHGIARLWNEWGFSTTMGKHWTQPSVKQYLSNPRLVGQRYLHGEFYTGSWEPIIGEQTWDQLCAVLDRTSQMNQGRDWRRRYMLSGLIKCGLCGGTMYGGNNSKGRLFYTCRSRDVEQHTLAVAAQSLERLMTEAVMSRMQDAVIPTPTDETEPFVGEIDLIDVRQEIKETMDRMRGQEVSGPEAIEIVGILKQRERALIAERTAWNKEHRITPLERVTKAEFQSWAEEGEDGVERQRVLVEQWVKAVVVSRPRTRYPGPKFDPDRVQVVWQE